MQLLKTKFLVRCTGPVFISAFFQSIRVAACFILFVMTLGSVCAQSESIVSNRHVTSPQKSSIKERVARLRSVSNVLRQTAASPLPSGLSASDFAEAQRYVVWLRSWAARLEALAADGESTLGITRSAVGSASTAGGGQSEMLEATKNMQETQMSFNLQYLEIQNQMQNENRQFTAVSNIMKTKHDTVKNSISNVR